MDTLPICGKIGVVGTGVIGAGWVAYFLARGLDVVATDPADSAEIRLRKFVDESWPALSRVGLAERASRDRLQFDSDLRRALNGCSFVQENGPERIDKKRELLSEISDAVSQTTIIATSSSGIQVSDIQRAARSPERIILGHPFNPCHLMPLVEVAGGQLTSQECVDAGLAFYRAIGKKAIHLRHEINGHIANRLQAALWREAFYLVEKGIASVEDIDTAIAHGPGLRWGLLGPFLNMHLSGGAGGISHVLEHLGPPMEGWWRELGDVALSSALKDSIARGVAKEIGAQSYSQLLSQRDRLLLGLLTLKSDIEMGSGEGGERC